MDGSWLHPSRLPLGAGWHGGCCAAGEEFTPSDSAIRDFCNLGNAHGCPSLPADRDWDAVRFSIALISDQQVTLSYICERGHAPVEHGRLTYDRRGLVWRNPHPDARVHRLANCYLETWRMRQVPVAV